jgi:hypothetical protein
MNCLADLAAQDTPETRQAVIGGKVEDWATESLLAAREAYRVPETEEQLKSEAVRRLPQRRPAGLASAPVSGAC